MTLESGCRTGHKEKRKQPKSKSIFYKSNNHKKSTSEKIRKCFSLLNKSSRFQFASGGPVPRARLLPLPSLRSVQWLQPVLLPLESPPFATFKEERVHEVVWRSVRSTPAAKARRPRPRRERSERGGLDASPRKASGKLRKTAAC